MVATAAKCGDVTNTNGGPDLTGNESEFGVGTLRVSHD